MAEPFAGIQPADRPAVDAWAEATYAKNLAATALKADPVLGRLLAEHSPELANLIPDVVQVVVESVAPAICDGYEADLARLRASAESEVDKLTQQRDRQAHIRHMNWNVAQRLREATAELIVELDGLRSRRQAEFGATVSLLRAAAAKAVERGHQDYADRLAMAADEHASEGCAVMLADCTAVRFAIELLAEYRAEPDDRPDSAGLPCPSATCAYVAIDASDLYEHEGSNHIEWGTR